MTMREEPLTDEDLRKVGASRGAAEAFQQAGSAPSVPTPEKQRAQITEDNADLSEEQGPLPPWALPLPPGLTLPKGRHIYALRFRAQWTETREKGDRYCILWSLTEADERLAYQRTRGDTTMALNEMAKQTIRVVGFVQVDNDPKLESATGSVITAVDWGTGGSSVTEFWNGIGGKCRAHVKNTYLKMHTMEIGEYADFFSRCVAVRTVGG